MRSAIKQVASGRFGVTTEYLVNSDMMQIKMAQGAKPGEGGQLPGHKVDAVIAKVRHSTPGVGLISPPPHHDIYSIEDLKQLIYDLKNVNPAGDVSVKLVSEVGVGTVAAGVAKAKSDHVTIAGYEGGTGASPLTSIKHAGSPWEIGLAETHQTLVRERLRGRIAVQVDGGFRTGRDVVIGALLGADEFGFSTAPLISLGCIMMRQCHLNTCPVGVATQDPVLRKRFTGKPEHVINYFFFVAEEVRELMAAMGFRTFDEMIGQMQMLDTRRVVDHWKARGLDFSRLFHKPDAPEGVAIHHCEAQDHELDHILDRKLIGEAWPALEARRPVQIETRDQQHRPHGRRHALRRGRQALRPRRAARGHHPHHAHRHRRPELRRLGRPRASPSTSSARPTTTSARACPAAASSSARRRTPASFRRNSIIVGNTVLYGAIAGECYFRGIAGERFAVRNSGAVAVVEGAGDHCCEYMTGGVVVVIGQTGRNFAAGMSGGIAYVLDEDGTFERRCNLAMIDLEPVTAEEEATARSLHQSGDLEGHGLVDVMGDLTRHDAERLRLLIERHAHYTGSTRARADPRRLGGVPAEVPQGDAGRVPPRAGRDGPRPGRAADRRGGGVARCRTIRTRRHPPLEGEGRPRSGRGGVTPPARSKAWKASRFLCPGRVNRRHRTAGFGAMSSLVTPAARSIASAANAPRHSAPGRLNQRNASGAHCARFRPMAHTLGARFPSDRMSPTLPAWPQG